MSEPARRSQSLIEMAVFAAVLFYLIGAMASNYMSASATYGSQLKSLRQAMTLSYQSSQAGDASRVAASFLSYEDRLGTDVGKYGPSDRQPVITSGSAMFNKNGSMPQDWNETGNRPLMDLYVNGQHFKLTTAAYVNYQFYLKAGEDDVDIYMLDPGCSMTTWLWFSTKCPGDGCLRLINSEENKAARERMAKEWRAYASQDMRFYTAIVSNNESFVTTPNGSCDAQCLKDRFDYNRNFDDTDDMRPPYSYAVWQWTWKTKGEVWYQAFKAAGDDGDGNYPSVDVDGDLIEETVYFFTQDINCPVVGPGKTYEASFGAAVMSQTAGDVDSTKTEKDYRDPYKRPGMLDDMRIYTRTFCVPTNKDNCSGGDTITYYDLREGRRQPVSTDGRPVSISTTKKNQYDIVERAFKLNDNMVDPAGFIARNPGVLRCDGPVLNRSEGGRHTGVGDGCCFEGGRMFQTCFDATAKVLYIRSRISDKRGHRWTTSTEGTLDQATKGAP